MQFSRSHAPRIARLALGTLFLVFGLNGFFQFLPQPATPPPPAALSFAGALYQTGYLLPLIKGTEVFASLLLLGGRYVPFALTLLAPIVVNIVAFHVFLAPGAVPLALAFTVLGLGLYLAWGERAAFQPLFQTRRRASALDVGGARRGAPVTT